MCNPNFDPNEFPVKIDIRGIGLLINRELEIIKKSFLDAKYNIKIYNDYPSDDKNKKEEIIVQTDAVGLVEINMHHSPWGG